MTRKNAAPRAFTPPPSTLPAPAGRAPRSPCPVGRALDILGDRWTLLIVRDMMLNGKRTYKDFQDAPESIPTNTLAARLKLLEETGLVEKSLYQTNPARYEYALTKRGIGLKPVLVALRDWSADVQKKRADV